MFTEERYDYAKKLKLTISDLQKAGEKLGKFEVSKRQAVENEDYDKAKLKKVGELAGLDPGGGSRDQGAKSGRMNRPGS